MANIADVAVYILKNYGSTTTMKLQKLAYYSQAESLSRHARPLFDEDFQAWRGGPVCSELYALHKGKFIIRANEIALPSGQINLTVEEQQTIDRVCSKLFACTGNELSRRTHREKPWIDARGGLAPAATCRTVISKEAIRDFYQDNPVIAE
ncbi:Panacea domain-containing protein [Bifidobacterium panos]|uniref:Antitoxin SocA-like Panacea domain-containing protein n=1 Tax=Bifidobacterium panos TaxID=2675321 RepID=A0ABX1SVX6_9BIFI|nr:type II toxin-antitoxin system antitoxin SocA domain-containing protein [Bifidobacterium sp. DSM 109963]NMN01986.1 hypothetical protein [Bifidobacterium sp. DSM 109963]